MGDMIKQFCVAHGHPSCQACHFAQLDRLKELESELATARETIRRLNRRCQAADAAVAEKLKAPTGSLGRALANYAAHMRGQQLALAQKVIEAARAVYEHDDAFTAQREGDGRTERDTALGEALAELDAANAKGNENG